MVSASGNRTAILDHGYIEVVEMWGSDERIIEAARMSTAKGFQGWGTPETPGDEKLLKFLYEHQHHTPFEMAGATFEIQAPIFVFREWHRHRTQSYNEMSGRYIQLPKLCYIPSDERIAQARQSASNKQGSTAFAHDLNLVLATVRSAFRDVYERAWAEYEQMLELGVARELASRVLPTAQYSRMRASANLRNWLGFLTLRIAPNAQWEIQQYANAVEAQLALTFPRTLELFRKAVGDLAHG